MYSLGHDSLGGGLVSALTTRGAARSVGTVAGRQVRGFRMGKVGSWKLQERLAWARFC